jgi:hypothetical protein
LWEVGVACPVALWEAGAACPLWVPGFAPGFS